MNPNKESDFPQFRIGKVAKILALSTSTLRQYEKLGLVLPYKEDGGQRLYSITDVEWLRQLKAYFAESGTGPSCLCRLMSLIPMREIRLEKVGKSCPLPATDTICWQASSDRLLCRSCPTYREKTAILSFERHFRIHLRRSPAPFVARMPAAG